MVSKKEALTLGLLVIGGIGAASMLAGSGDGGGGAGDLAPPSPRAGGILGSGGVPTGSESFSKYNIPVQEPVVFPQPQSFDFSKFFMPPEQAPVSRGAAGVSAAPKKWRETGKIGLGYKGYVSPTTPTPVSPGYIPGVTTFVPYTGERYIPSPIKPPSVSYGNGGGGNGYHAGRSAADRASLSSTYKRLRTGGGSSVGSSKKSSSSKGMSGTATPGGGCSYD